MIWHHIMDKQPEDDEIIIQVDAPYEDGHRPMGMRKYVQKCTFEEVIEYSRQSFGLDYCLNFWWISSKDFPFPKDRI